MKLTFIGADHEVTGSCHYLEAGGKHILVDYGMEQGVNVFENVPLPDGNTGSGAVVRLNNFFGELSLRGYDGKTYPIRTSGQEEWVGAVMDALWTAAAETDSK